MEAMTPRMKQGIMGMVADENGNYYYDGPLDGIWGPKSQAAAEKFLKDFTGEETEKKPTSDLWDGIKYFTPEECACRCSEKHAPYCDGFPVQPDRVMLEVADEIREEIGAPLIRTSVIRCKQHNIDEDGAADSRHLLGKAMDAWTPGLTSAQLLAIAQKNPRVRYAYAVDEQVVHFDVE